MPVNCVIASLSNTIEGPWGIELCRFTFLNCKVSSTISYYTETVNTLISEHDFYKHGWELTKTNNVAIQVEASAQQLHLEILCCTEFPGVVLISGGDQDAMSEWVERWAFEGYAAITCDYESA